MKQFVVNFTKKCRAPTLDKYCSKSKISTFNHTMHCSRKNLFTKKIYIHITYKDIFIYINYLQNFDIHRGNSYMFSTNLLWYIYNCFQNEYFYHLQLNADIKLVSDRFTNDISTRMSAHIKFWIMRPAEWGWRTGEAGVAGSRLLLESVGLS